jgi:amino acid transporter
MEKEIAVLIPIIGSIGLFTMIIFLRRYSHLERMRMIERGFNPGDLNRVWTRKDPYRHLRLSCTAIGIGIGWLVGTILRQEVWHSRDIMIAMIILMGGIGLFIGYMVQYGLQSKARKEGKDPFEEEI